MWHVHQMYKLRTYKSLNIGILAICTRLGLECVCVRLWFTHSWGLGYLNMFVWTVAIRTEAQLRSFNSYTVGDQIIFFNHILGGVSAFSQSNRKEKNNSDTQKSVRFILWRNFKAVQLLAAEWRGIKTDNCVLFCVVAEWQTVDCAALLFVPQNLSGQLILE